MLLARSCTPSRRAGSAGRCPCRRRGPRRPSPHRPRSRAAASDPARRGTRACCRSTWIRSARFGNRLMAGVQNSARFDLSTTLSRVGSPRPSRITSSTWLDSMRRRASASPVTSKNRYRCGKREVLLQQPVSLKRPQRHRQQGLLVGEADRLDGGGRQQVVRPRRRSCHGRTSTPSPVARHSSYSVFATSSRPPR